MSRCPSSNDTEGFEDQSRDIAEISTSTTMGTQIAVGVKVRMFARAVKSQSRPAVAVPAWTNISLAAIYGSKSLAANTNGVRATIRQSAMGTVKIAVTLSKNVGHRFFFIELLIVSGFARKDFRLAGTDREISEKIVGTNG